MNTQLPPKEIVQRALEIAGDICVYTNKNITVLLDSKYTLSLLDCSQVWTDPPKGGTFLNVISSNADLIADYPNEVILDLVLKELHPGVTLEDVKQQLGHSSITLTSNTYSHVLEKRQREVARAMDAVLGG